MLIVSAFGVDPALLQIIVVIGIILDDPATLLNSTENTVWAMLVARLVECKDWLKNKMDNDTTLYRVDKIYIQVLYD